MKLQIVGHSVSLSMLRVDIAYREEILRISGQAAKYISSVFFVKKIIDLAGSITPCPHYEILHSLFLPAILDCKKPTQ